VILKHFERPSCDYILHAYLDRLRFESFYGYFPRSTRHKLLRRKYACFDHAKHRSHADLQAACSFSDADCFRSGGSWIERRNSESFAQSAHTKRGPGLAIVSLAPHSIHGHGQFSVRPVCAERSDHLHRARMSIIGISTSPDACHAYLGVPPTCSVDRHIDFVPGIIQVYDYFLDQNPG
jgi:hypothetical protein